MISSGFWSSCAAFGSSACLIAQDRTVSHADLARIADDWALRARTLLPPGLDRPLVALEMTASVVTVAAYLGCLRASWPVILLAPGQGDASGSILSTYGPNLVQRADGGSPDLSDPRPCPMDADLAMLLSTSGTTGAVKLVRLSGRNIHSNALAIADYLEIGAQDTAITTLPLHYSYGMSVLNSYLAAGARLVLTEESVTADSFWAQARGAGVTSLALEPTQFELLDKIGFQRATLPSLRYVTQAGGRLDPILAQRFAHAAPAEGCQLVIMYGQTEASPRIADMASASNCPTMLFGSFGYGNIGDEAVPSAFGRMACAAGEDLTVLPVSRFAKAPMPDIVYMGDAVRMDRSSLSGRTVFLSGGGIVEPHSNSCLNRLAELRRQTAPFDIQPFAISCEPGVTFGFRERRRLRRLLRGLPEVLVRDEVSQRALESIFQDVPVRVIGDIVLWLEGEALPGQYARDLPERYIAVSLASIWDDEAFFSWVAAELAQISRRLDATILLVPISNAVGDDVAQHRRLCRILDQDFGARAQLFDSTAILFPSRNGSPKSMAGLLWSCRPGCMVASSPMRARHPSSASAITPSFKASPEPSDGKT